MAHSKKSRKVGKIGVSKVDSPRQVKLEGKSKNTRGNKSGTRQLAHTVNNEQQNKAKQDPKLGSKKPVDLSKYKAGADATETVKQPAQVKYKTPQAELEAIENNKELEALLDKQAKQALSKSEQSYVDKMTKRYSQLCELLGISEDEDETEDLVDPYASLDAIKLDDFKD